jgi:DNA-3-methyladenine glycosylase II
MTVAKFEDISDATVFANALSHLRANDPILARVIKKHGVIEFETSGEIFESLVESIIGQQVSGYAANAIIARVRSLYSSGNLEPEAIYRTNPRRLRKAGISPQKLRYLKDLSRRIVKKELEIESLRDLPDEKLVEALDPVLGIGPWTVHMLLIFTLGRTNVLPVDDLGIRKSVQTIYDLSEMPSAEEIRTLAKKWHPYCSVASLYLWKAKDVVQPISAKRKDDGPEKKKHRFPAHVRTSSIRAKKVG